MRSSRATRLLLGLVFVLVLPFLRGAGGASAQPQQTSSDRLSVVRQAFDLLYSGFVFPLSSDQLLNDAWDGLNTALTGANQTAVNRPPFTGDPNADWTAFAAAYRRVVTTGVLPARDLAYGAINQMLTARNSCHTYFNPPEVAAVVSGRETHQQTVFIGLVTARDSSVVYRVYPDSPADRAGIRPGDTLLASAGQGAPGIQRRMLLTPVGKPIVVTVQRLGVDQPIDLTLVPELTVLPFIRTAVLPGGIGVIQFDDFTTGAGLQAAIRQALADFEAQGVVGWVLDVRTSPGGDGNSMAAVASLFLDNGTVITEIDRAGGRFVVKADGVSAVQLQRPLVVLTEHYSASAADMLPGALQDDGRAYVIGDTTDGCISSGRGATLTDGSSMLVEASRVLVGNDALDLDGIGVTPNETIVRTPEILASGQDPQMDRAVEYLLSVAGR